MHPAAPEQAPPSRPQRTSGPAPGGRARRRAPSGAFEPAQLVSSFPDLRHGLLAKPSASAREFVRMFGGPQTFPSAITPVQTAVALAALGVVASPEGARLRKSVAAVATF